MVVKVFLSRVRKEHRLMFQSRVLERRRRKYKEDGGT
jgi:hypothetical protein